MDTVKKQDAFYKQADARYDRGSTAERGDEASSDFTNSRETVTLRFRASDKNLSVMTGETRRVLSRKSERGFDSHSPRVSREYGRFYEKSNFDSRL